MRCVIRPTERNGSLHWDIHVDVINDAGTMVHTYCTRTAAPDTSSMTLLSEQERAAVVLDIAAVAAGRGVLAPDA